MRLPVIFLGLNAAFASASTQTFLIAALFSGAAVAMSLLADWLSLNVFDVRFMFSPYALLYSRSRYDVNGFWMVRTTNCFLNTTSCTVHLLDNGIIYVVNSYIQLGIIFVYKLNKIHGHIKMQELQQLKLSRYLNEAKAMPVPDPDRIRDIERALKRVTENINMWKSKLSAFENAPPREPSRPAINDGPNQPLIG